MPIAYDLAWLSALLEMCLLHVQYRSCNLMPIQTQLGLLHTAGATLVLRLRVVLLSLKFCNCVACSLSSSCTQGTMPASICLQAELLLIMSTVYSKTYLFSCLLFETVHSVGILTTSRCWPAVTTTAKCAFGTQLK